MLRINLYGKNIPIDSQVTVQHRYYGHTVNPKLLLVGNYILISIQKCYCAYPVELWYMLIGVLILSVTDSKYFPYFFLYTQTFEIS